MKNLTVAIKNECPCGNDCYKGIKAIPSAYNREEEKAIFIAKKNQNLLNNPCKKCTNPCCEGECG